MKTYLLILPVAPLVAYSASIERGFPSLCRSYDWHGAFWWWFFLSEAITRVRVLAGLLVLCGIVLGVKN